MINISKTQFPSHLKKKVEELKQSFLDHLDNNISLPGNLKFHLFPNTFFDSEFYLLYPSLFKKVFGERDNHLVQQLCISGFFYFRYLLCLDAMNDKDELPGSPPESTSITLLKAHVYQDEALKILARMFGDSPGFWQLWSKRNSEFLGSILLDAAYNPQMSFDTYKKLCITKCSISKVAIDAYFSKHSRQKKLYDALQRSIDNFSIARCIQDDLEDFKKDLLFKKNNLGHILLHEWFKERGNKFQDHSPEMIEKYFFISELAEKLMQMSRDYYQQAIDDVKPYQSQLGDYLKILGICRNNMNYYKVNTHAYRINTYLGKINSPEPPARTPGIAKAIGLSVDYLRNMQNKDGSWYEISNMQGLSNVWSTGFIASFLEPGEESLDKAADFLVQHRQAGLWGYNTDWTPDYDSTTAALLTLNKTSTNVHGYINSWLKGQSAKGGFSTYSSNNPALSGFMGLKPSQLKGWIGDHQCVSALAYYLLNQLPDKAPYQRKIKLLRNYLLDQRNEHGIWSPYWWTSYLYPTCFTLQSMLLEDQGVSPEAEKAMDYVMRSIRPNGSYACDMITGESVFYTSLVLDTLCASPQWVAQYRKEMMGMKKWILSHQYRNGAFPGTDFLVIPNPGTIKWNNKQHTFRLNKSGGGNTITGEIASLFSTAVATRALKRFREWEPAARS
ncbi:prenyltransferase/squalene oxidase repeat-containing protein [Chitinophaga sp. MM2321]|uniref:prenyltransferase/squalene oxidase repeat-containing protein n=1 Tax=Chitinophaga sp. MM2321 TaxID=3137178 RepID=UPI0032D58483